MPSYNQIIIMGHIGKDPELKTSKSGSSFINFSVATTHKYKNKQSGELISETEWHSVSAFGTTADYVAKYGSKGVICFVEGRVKTNRWKDQQGVEQTRPGIMANNISLIKPQQSNQGQSSGYSQQGNQQNNQNQQQGQNDFSDDIPF